MNRAVLSILTLASVAAGFAAGWLNGTHAPSEKSAGVRSTTPVTEGPAGPKEAAPLELPELSSAEDCREFLRLVDALYQGRHPLFLQSIRDYALRRWLELDAESALAEAERDPGDEYGKSGFAVNLFRVWLDLDAASAVKAWHQASRSLARTVRYSFLSALAEKDGPAALAACRASRDKKGSSWDFTETEVFRVWSKHDPRAAAEATQLSQSLEYVMNEWVRTDPAAAADWLRSHNTDPRYRAALLPWLLQTDPAAVAELMKAPKEGGLAPYSKHKAIREWTQYDPAGALRWAESQPPNGPMVWDVLSAAATMIAYSDPQRALEILQRAPKSAPPVPQELKTLQSLEIGGAWRQVFASEAARDITRAQELVMNQPLVARRDALHGYFEYAFSANPDAAIEQCRKWIADPSSKDLVLAAFADSLKETHGAGARDPSAGPAAIPEFATRIDAAVLRGWAENNPRAAAKFIAQRAGAGSPVGGLKADGVLAGIAVSEPVWTSQWVQTLTDTGLQNEAAETLTANWAAFDPDAARLWTETLPEGPLREAAEKGFNRRSGK